MFVSFRFGGYSMDEARKKPLMIGVIVVCLVVAVAITIKTWPRGAGDIPKIWKKPEYKVWVKCRNPACKAEYQMNKYAYHKAIKDYFIEHPQASVIPGLKCKKCGKDSLYLAYKCPKCGTVFEGGLKRGDFSDRCPKCGYSKTEADRKKKASLTKE